MLKKYQSLVWDIETGSAQDLQARRAGYVRLVGYQGDDDEPVVTTDVDLLIQLILMSERHYGFNSLGFDCAALALHYDVDYRDLTENNVDLMLVERQVNPPNAKGGYPRGYWGLNQTVVRYGGEGKTDNLPKLAARFGGFDKIPVDNPEYVSYTYGDIAATRFLVDKIGHHYDTDPYISEEHETMRRIHYGITLNGLRVDKVENDHRLEMQRIKRERNFRKLEDDFGIPIRGVDKIKIGDPFKSAEGKEWFEKKCRELGIGDLVPRTIKGAVSLAAKGLDKMLSEVPDDNEDAVLFLSEAVGAIQGQTEEGLQYFHDRFGLPLEREVKFESKKPLSSTRGKERLEILFEELGATRVYRTDKTKQISTNREHLEKAVDFYSHEGRQREARMTPMPPENVERFRELVDVIIDVTTERSVFSTIRDNTKGDGRVYPEIDASQASGRWSLTRPGLTVMGKKKGKWREREVILADDDDSVIVCFDADQVDARAIAGHSQDPEYMKFFEPGKDLHSEVAMMVFGRCDGEWRENAKVLGHGINYGLGPKGAANQANVELSVATQFATNYARSFPVLEQWKGRVRAKAENKFPLDNGFGRMMKADAQRAYTQAPALSGQGATRDLMARWLKRLDWDVVRYLRGIVHDEFVFSFPKDRARELSRKVVEAGHFEWRGVPITCGASKPGLSWGGCYDPDTVDMWPDGP